MNSEPFLVLQYQYAALTATDIGHVSESKCFHGLRSIIKARSIVAYGYIDFGAVAIGRCILSLVLGTISKISLVALGTI